MTVGTISQVMTRVKHAEKTSPIAVFKTSKGLDAMFANTVNTRARILDGDYKLVGVWHKLSNQQDVRQRLKRTGAK